MDDLYEELTGSFRHIVYRSESYMVAKFESEEGTITVTGPSFDVEKGQKYLLIGTYVDHPRYGFQFNILKVEKAMPKQKEEIISFLSSSMFKGVGKKAAAKIYDALGEGCLKILEEDISVLQDIGLTAKQILSLEEGFASLKDPEHEILFHLVSHGFNNLDAQKIFARFKLATIEVGEENPFRYYNEVYGISFEKVKNYASEIEFDEAELKYKESYILYFLTDLTFQSGDTYVLKEELFQKLAKIGMRDIEEAYERALENRYLVEEEGRVYLILDHTNEAFISDYLRHFKSEAVLPVDEIEDSISLFENKESILFDKAQKAAITSFFTSPVSLIVGGPGTGKTTIVKAMVSLFKQHYQFGNIIVIAPTGRAAKRIAEVCDVEAKTIHSLLRWNKESNTFNFGLDNPVLYDCVIVDEFSMVDADLFASLLKAGSRFRKLCMIGDDTQLPSIRPGAVLRDLIASSLFPMTRLTVNYRQKEGSEIIDLANSIIENEMDLSKYEKDVLFIDNAISHKDLISLINEDRKEGYDLDDIQVLTPMYKGPWGIDDLNTLLQDNYNPRSLTKPERRNGRMIFREGDKILQLKNRPNDDVCNGDIGILEDIDMREKELMVNFQGIYVFYGFDDLSDISLAYAMSVHKSQGSEYPIVYFIVSRNNVHMLNKNLIYTAISRARKKLVILGEEDLLRYGISHSERQRRTTLTKRLTEV